ncbi:DEAD-box ATP-dependent RNA helicase 42 [Stylosanthes scabra]|uniref:RNA helicase n=1 Tax=Stylosanthes scabra TaxID=79078 RepID=A0ABU6W3Y2_9FABA|nr:DEAD-box ATP-dependent RNA helicase 42 [Stylosanthes scabra]
MEDGKHKSRREDSEVKEDDSKRSHRDRGVEKDKDRSNGKHRDREKRDRDSRRHDRDHSSDDSDDKYDREREKEKEKRRGKDKEERRAREKKREREREKEREREDKERERRERAKEKERERERERERREREREREREKDKDRRERERDKEIERERGRRVRDREKRREVDSDYSDDDSRERERDRKRHKKEDDDYKGRDKERSSGKSHKQTEDVEVSPRRKSGEDDSDAKVKERKPTHEEEIEEEHKRLDEEMEKRRRRVQEWQELRRKKEEAEREKQGEASASEPKLGKAWTLEGESDDEEATGTGKPDTPMDVDEDEKPVDKEPGDPMVADGDNGAVTSDLQDGTAGAPEDDEIDPLDGRSGQSRKVSNNKSIGRIIPGEDSDSDYSDLQVDDEDIEENDEEFMKRVKKSKADKLSIVDHSKIDYQPFKKNFYIEVKDISRLTPEEVAAYRKELELKIHGKDVPKPVKSWHQTGLTSKILETIRKLNYEKPMPIQAQALPVIMSGRDCIGIAKTGSGKTLAFVLPMLRHIKDQPPVVTGDGPIGLIMAPTRELVQQIYSDIKKFGKVLGLRCVPVYGGSGVAQQISELKRGAEIVVCTPGRMIDILCTSGGKITNLRRVEVLARKVLNKPVEIQVGGRSVVNKDITQLVELRPEKERFHRLLEILGEWYEKGKILIFVQSQEKCDALFKDLLKSGYPCLSLHGAKDQTDRESTIADFKSNVCNMLIATSIAARGLDVKELELVINFDVPNHYEDYVHRVGRTGRAGRKGCAITFISEGEARYAPDLAKALELSEQVVPDDLKALADGFMAKVKQGLEQAHGTGYGGSGFKFNEEEDEERRAAKKAQAKGYGFEEDKSDSEDEDENIRKSGGDISQLAQILGASKGTVPAIPSPISTAQLISNGGLNVPLQAVLGNLQTTTVLPIGGLPLTTNDGAARAALAAINLQHNLAKIQNEALPEHYEAELEINDFPQNARWKVTHKETLGPISEWTGAAITTRGQYFPPGKIAGPGERKLYLFIEGPSEQSVKRAKAELKSVLEDITNQALQLPGGSQPGKYSVV